MGIRWMGNVAVCGHISSGAAAVGLGGSMQESGRKSDLREEGRICTADAERCVAVAARHISRSDIPCRAGQHPVN